MLTFLPLPPPFLSLLLKPDFCMATCDAAGFKYAGLEYGYECHCSNNEPAGSVIAESNCNVPCEFPQPVPFFTPSTATDVILQHSTGIANSGKMCGAGGIMNIYTKGTASQGASSSCRLIQSPIPRASSAPPPQSLPSSTSAPLNSSYSQYFLSPISKKQHRGSVGRGRIRGCSNNGRAGVMLGFGRDKDGSCCCYQREELRRGVKG